MVAALADVFLDKETGLTHPKWMVIAKVADKSSTTTTSDTETPKTELPRHAEEFSDKPPKRH